MPETSAGDYIMGELCTAFPHFCVLLQEGFWDYDDEIDNSQRIISKKAHSPQGTGWRNLIHYAQIIASKEFQRFDYGKAMNLQLYGQESPPAYDLSKISVPYALATGDVDQLADPEDVKWLINESGLRSDLMQLHKEYHFGHCSFEMAKDMSWFKNDFMPLI